MKKRQYSEDVMRRAVKYVRSNQGSIREAARRFGVPRSSIQFKVTHPNTKCTSGPSAFLTEAEETDLADYIIDLVRRGFPGKKADIQISAQKFLLANPRKTPFRNNLPNYGWFSAFLRRHPHISMALNSAASITEDEIKVWYRSIRQFMSEEKLFCVLTDPKRLFKLDETKFKLCSNTGKIFTDASQHSSQNITVLFSFSATGLVTNPMLVYPNEKLPDRAAQTMPTGWGISCSSKGKTTIDSFYSYIKDILYPDLVMKSINLPIILFVDRKTPVTLSISELCKNLGIHLIAIYPNSTRIQASVCQPFKSSWRKGLRTSYQTPLTNLTFNSLFENIFNDLTKPEVLVEAFHKLGLFPFEEENIDCSKETINLKETIEMIEDQSEDDSQSDDENELEENNEIKFKNSEGCTEPVSEILDCDEVISKKTAICDICLDNISEDLLECHKCCNKYHSHCIPGFHIKHVHLPDKEFSCHICS